MEQNQPATQPLPKPDKPIPEWNATNVQIAAVMLFGGTHEQRVEAFTFLSYYHELNLAKT